MSTGMVILLASFRTAKWNVDAGFNNTTYKTFICYISVSIHRALNWTSNMYTMCKQVFVLHFSGRLSISFLYM